MSRTDDPSLEAESERRETAARDAFLRLMQVVASSPQEPQGWDEEPEWRKRRSSVLDAIDGWGSNPPREYTKAFLRDLAWVAFGRSARTPDHDAHHGRSSWARLTRKGALLAIGAALGLEWEKDLKEIASTKPWTLRAALLTKFLREVSWRGDIEAVVRAATIFFEKAAKAEGPLRSQRRLRSRKSAIVGSIERAGSSGRPEPLEPALPDLGSTPGQRHEDSNEKMLSLANNLCLQGRLEPALSLFQGTSEWEARPWIRNRVAHCLRLLGEYEKAYSIFEETLRLPGRSEVDVAHAECGLGHVALYRQAWGPAARHLETALARWPPYENARRALVVARLLGGKLDAAATAFGPLKSSCPEFEVARRSAARLRSFLATSHVETLLSVSVEPESPGLAGRLEPMRSAFSRADGIRLLDESEIARRNRDAPERERKRRRWVHLGPFFPYRFSLALATISSWEWQDLGLAEEGLRLYPHQGVINEVVRDLGIVRRHGAKVTRSLFQWYVNAQHMKTEHPNVEGNLDSLRRILQQAGHQ